MSRVEDNDGLPEELAAFVAADARDDSFTEEKREKLYLRVSMTAAAAGAMATKAIWQSLFAKIFALCVVGGAIAVTIFVWQSHRGAPTAAATPTVAIAPPLAVSLPAVVATPPAIATAPEIAVVKAPVDETKKMDHASNLAEEMKLIDAGRSALAKRDAAAAIEELDRYVKKFPRGQFIEEAEALRVQAFVADGAFANAKKFGAQFHKRFPQSLLAPVVDKSLESIP